MTTAFVNKVRSNDDKFGVSRQRYRVITSRSTSRVLSQVNRLTRWGWQLSSVGGITPRAVIVKKELVMDNENGNQVLFPQRYDLETHEFVNVYHMYRTKWTFTHKKMLDFTNTMSFRGYEVAFHVSVVLGYRTVFVKTYVKDMKEELA